MEEPDYRKLPKLYKEYVRYGGFPAVVLADEAIKDAVLNGIYDTVLLNDVGQRSGVREPMVLKMLTKFLASNIGQTVNPTKLANTLISANIKTSAPTVSNYLENIVAGYLFYHADKYDIRGKEYLRAKGKYFIADLGLRSVALGKKQTNKGSMLENIVYLELLRRGYAIDVGQINTGNEIDFIARKEGDILYVQVAYQLPEESTRETDNLLRIPDNYRKIVITEVEEEWTEIDGIPIINILDWLMDE
jgi:predicted AAA+ superfamily ATPase